MTQRFRECARGDHNACAVVTARSAHGTHYWCICACHDFNSVACAFGAHALCDREACRCECRHVSNHERVALRGTWAA